MGSERERVLVVDDELAIREAMRRILRASGLAFDGAATVGEAVHKLTKEGPFAFVFIDLKLGKEDGLEVLRVARALQPMVASFVVTGEVDPEHQNRSVLVDGAPVLAKPLDALTVAQAIARGRGDADRRVQLLAGAVDAFLRAFDVTSTAGIESTYARRMLEAIAELRSPKETQTSDGRPLTEWEVIKTRRLILDRSRLGSMDRVFKWLYEYAFRSLELRPWVDTDPAHSSANFVPSAHVGSPLNWK